MDENVVIAISAVIIVGLIVLGAFALIAFKNNSDSIIKTRKDHFFYRCVDSGRSVSDCEDDWFKILKKESWDKDIPVFEKF